MKTLKLLIWTYFGLLLTEGAFRKWFLPGLSNPLLIVRDPVVLLIYLQAYRLGRFPGNVWFKAVAALSFCTLIGGILAEFVNPWVMAFGLRTDFLHIPLIFIMSEVFDETDVRRIGKAVLLLALPMALLMTMQFRAGPHDWINAGAGGGGQISSAMGKIRPAGTFSFISGPVFFYATVSAFLLAGLLARGSCPLWLLSAAGGATMLASVVSGSRSLLGSVAVVALAMFVGVLLYPRAAVGSLRIAIVMGLLFIGVSSTRVFHEGQTVMAARIENAAGGKDLSTGIVRRFGYQFLVPEEVLFETPLFGRGLGLGTNAGAGLIGIRNHFLLAEGEWARVVAETGVILGGLFLLLRILLTAFILMSAVGTAREGRFMPQLLFGAGGLGLINGQWGQPTIQGFATFLCGLSLAAMRRAPVTEVVCSPTVEESQGLKSFEPMPAPVDLFAEVRTISRMDDPQPGRFAVRS